MLQKASTNVNGRGFSFRQIKKASYFLEAVAITINVIMIAKSSAFSTISNVGIS